MNGGGEDYIDNPWDFLTFYILMGMARFGLELIGCVEYDGGAWG